jgi:hypothetical protein
MSTWKRWTAVAGFALGVGIPMLAAPASAASDAPAVDPAALRILKQTTDLLDGLKQFKVSTQNIIEDMHSSGHRVDYDLSANVTLKRPNKLRADRTGQLLNQRFFYDGKALTLYSPSEKVYATQAAPETVEKMISFARETVGVLLPAADLFFSRAYPLMTQDLTAAVVVGKAVVGGVSTNHLLFVRPGAEFQIWVEDGARPWPRKYVVTETDTPEKLSITTFLTDWNDAPAVDDAQFAFVPPAGTSETRFIPYGTTAKAGR